jgi:PAS domain S-box-containing protein
MPAAAPPTIQASDETARAVLNAVPEAIVVAKLDGEIAFLNRFAEALFGYASEEAAGQSIAMLTPTQPGRRAEAMKWLERWAHEPLGVQRHVDLIARRKDGAEMPVDVRVAEQVIGGETRYVVTVRDNSLLRREQAALKDENIRALRMLLMSEDAIVSCDADQRITFLNIAAERMFGYLFEEAQGQPLGMLLPPAARELHPVQMTAFGAGVAPSRMMSERREVSGLRKNGEIFPIEAAISKVVVGGELVFTAHLRDVTRRRAEQARLEESERRFRAIFEHATAAIALLSPDGTVLEINEAGRKLTRGGEALTGRPLWELPWIGAEDAPPDSAARVRLRQAILAAAGGRIVRDEAELTDGLLTRKIDLVLTPIRDETGKVVYILPEGREKAG